MESNLMEHEMKLQIKGTVTLTVIGDGYQISHTFSNLITSFGLAFLAQMVANPAGTTFDSFIAVGTGTTQPTEGDIVLEAELARVSATRKALTGGDSNQVEFQAVFGRGVVVGDVTEAGIFDASAGGNMFNRSVFTAVPVTVDQALLINWRVAFQNVTP